MTGADARLPALLARAAAGDTAAFMAFYDATKAVAYRYACAATGSSEAADDLTRTTYLRAWADAGRQPASGLSPVAWLLSIAATARAAGPHSGALETERVS